jgi:hypothetical protein
MKILIILFLLNFSSIFSTHEEDSEPANPLEHSDDMTYLWCVKLEKNEGYYQVFKTFLEIKKYMRQSNRQYIFIKDCYVQETIPSKYKKIYRIIIN